MKSLSNWMAIAALAAALTAQADSVFYFDAEGNLRTTEESYTETFTSTTASLSNGRWYVVQGDVTVSTRIKVSGSVNLILCDGATLTAPKGIRVKSGNSLTIYGQTGGSGQLIINDVDDGAAGIGGDNRGNNTEDCGTVTINGGEVKATGGNDSAGIGGGRNGSGGRITVNNGTVEAAGGADAPGIGSGLGGSGGTVTIKGGTVTAIGGAITAMIGSESAAIALYDSLSIPGMKVYAGADEMGRDNPVPHAQRESICYFGWARLKVCAPHIFGWRNNGTDHTLVCEYCGSDGGTEPHAYVNGVCACGAHPVAKIERTGTGYASLKAALDAAVTNDTVTLLAEINRTTEDPDPGQDYLIKIKKDVTLDLNGQVITAAGTRGRVLYVNGCTATIIDGDPDYEHSTPITYTDPVSNATVTVNGGVITGGGSYGGGLVDGGTLFMSGGTIAGNNGYEAGGVGITHNGTFSMSGKARVSGNTASQNGGGVLVQQDGSFSMSGDALVSGNTASKNGGGVLVQQDGSFSMSGSARVSGNKASDGGGVFVNIGSLSMSGDASVCDNSASDSGGGVVVDADGSFSMSGSASVTGNTKGDAANNVYLPGGRLITVSGALTNGANVGISMENPGIFTTGYSTYNTAAPRIYFFDDNEAYGVGLKKDSVSNLDEAALGLTVTYHGNGATGGTAPEDSYIHSPGDMVTVAGNTGNLVKTGEGTAYAFTGWTTDAEGTGTVYSPDGANPTYTMGGSSVTFYAKWVPAVAKIERTGTGYTSLKAALDAAENDDTVTLLAEINRTTENPSDYQVSLVAIRKPVTLDLNGQVINAGSKDRALFISEFAVTITDTGTESENSYTNPVSGGTVTVNGGLITGSADSAVWIANGADLSMDAGTIAGNTAAEGAGVYIYEGSFSMSGTASVSGNTVTENGGGVYIADGSFNFSGSASVTGNTKGDAANNVYLPGGKVITLSGALTNGASIGISMATPGIFTAGYSTYNTAAPNTWFSSDDTAYVVALDTTGEAILGKRTGTLDVTQEDGIYGTTLPDPSYERPAAGGTVTVVYSGTNTLGTAYGPTADKPTEAGGYTVDVTYETEDTIYTGGATFTIAPKDIAMASVASIDALVYEGGPLEPVPTVTDGDPSIITTNDYAVSWADNDGPGTGRVILTGKNNYTGRKQATFTILAPPSVSNIVARQRWPWNGLVDIDYDTGGSTDGLEAVIVIEDAANNRSWTATTFLAGAVPSAAPGHHRATWDAKADGATNVVAESVVATVKLVKNRHLTSTGESYCGTDFNYDNDQHQVDWGHRNPNHPDDDVPPSGLEEYFSEQGIVFSCDPGEIKTQDELGVKFALEGDSSTNRFYVKNGHVNGAFLSILFPAEEYTSSTYRVSMRFYLICPPGCSAGDFQEGAALRARTGHGMVDTDSMDYKFYAENDNGVTLLDEGTVRIRNDAASYGFYHAITNTDARIFRFEMTYYGTFPDTTGGPGHFMVYPEFAQFPDPVILAIDYISAEGPSVCLPSSTASSGHFLMDTRPGPFESDGSETLTFSSLWHGGANSPVTISQGDAALTDATALVGEGEYAWSVPYDGTYVLTHATSGASNVETVTFVVTGLTQSFADTDIVLTDYSGTYDGQPHTIGVETTNTIDGLVLKYCGIAASEAQSLTTNHLPLTTDKPLYTDVTNVVVYVEASAPGYFTTTNSATVTITKATNAWLTVPSMAGWTVGATPATPNRGRAKFGAATVAYGVAGGAADALGATRPSAAGNYTATFTVPGTANYDGLVRTVAFTIKPKPAPKTYTVTFDANGGKGGTTAKKAAGAALKAPAVTRAGYRLKGWTPAVPAAMPAANVTYRAVWTPLTYAVRFDANGGSLPKGKSMAAQTMALDKAAALRGNAFVRNGYVFIGWSKTKNGAVAIRNGQSVKNLGKAGQTVTLYAAWAKAEYKVVFDASGGRLPKGVKMPAQTFKYGKAQKLNGNKFTRKGYVFGGWAIRDPLATVPKIAYKNGQAVANLSRDGRTVKLYAVWKKR